ncbi:MAG: hypothetical protein RL173_300 [Fibrobacterota bacterium]|jgi:trehalose 6-phosphate synthase
MTNRLRFLLVLGVGIFILSLIADALLVRSARGWFIRDASLRARLTMTSANSTLANRVKFGDSTDIAALLSSLTRDERIMAIGLCDDSAATKQLSPLFPNEYSCGKLVGKWRQAHGKDSVWEMVTETPSGSSMVTVHTLRDSQDEFLGWVVLVQDLGFIDRRGSYARTAIFSIFGGLAVAAALLTFFAARFARRGWIEEFRQAMRGDKVPNEFRPLLQDVRDLVDELAQDRNQEGKPIGWTPDRLKAILHEQLKGERILVLANREPYIHQTNPDGSISVQHPASGLVTALEPVLRACSGTWIAHGSGTADRQSVDSKDRVAVPPDNPCYQLRRVWLGETEENGFYYGFSNEGLWPLCHLAHTRPLFREEDWIQYQQVNEKFAAAVCQEAEVDDPVVLVQDYHFALAPAMIRKRLPKATILTFWHIPWPNAERFGICPWREEILQGMLGSSIMGFHTQQHCNNFLEAVDTYLESRIDHEQKAVIKGGRTTLVRPYPISIAWPDPWTEMQPPVHECRNQVLDSLGFAHDVRLGIGVDRLDYTKGIEERFRAVDMMLENYPEFRGKFSFVQIGAPSRSRIPEYQRLNDAVVQVADEINRKWANQNWKPIVLLAKHQEAKDVYRYYRAADVCYVSSLHDGMNLVAKEFISSRDDEQGTLVLSQFAGAAKEMTEALIVNPYDFGQASSALAAALRMPPSEQTIRMRSMRQLLSQRNVYRWAGRMLTDASRLRNQERLGQNLSSIHSLTRKWKP